MQFAHHYHMMSPTYHLLHKHILQNKCTSTSDFWITGSNAVMALCIPHYYMDSDVTWGNGMGCTLLALSADLQSVHGFHCYDDIAPNTKCQRVLRFMPGILVFFPFKPHVWQKLNIVIKVIHLLQAFSIATSYGYAAVEKTSADIERCVFPRTAEQHWTTSAVCNGYISCLDHCRFNSHVELSKFACVL